MRKLVTSILVISASTMLMFCSGKDGAPGPSGATGTNGTNGANGISNIITLKKRTTSIGWILNSTATVAAFEFSTPEITQAIIDNGGVDVELMSSGVFFNLFGILNSCILLPI